ncbi:isopropanol dehydrogenase [Fusarium albosuccineum]|uniref:Isopropanol dehydrogenase n=1 Tax=Fusarium albosuccineum TaxID=1237068 RepID=A0A8H4L091_9HYPO|nr:isopropanol dehydrogenase [Fusarium albosuccineum]
MATDLPSHHRALVLSKIGQPLSVETLPTPRATPGSVIIRVLVASVRVNTPDVFRNPDSLPTPPVPLVPGFIAIGTVVETGPDSGALEPGQLVFFDPYLLARDDRDVKYVCGMMEGFDEASRKFAQEWRNSAYAEYAKVPLENCHALDKERLFGQPEDGGLGYKLDDLTHLFSMLIPFGGLADIDVKAGDVAIIAPATGRYGSAAVHLALAMGAKVVAIGRNAAVLETLKPISPRLTTVALTGDVEKDTVNLTKATAGGADAFWDMSPAVKNLTHFRSCLNVLRPGGRVSLMGGALSEVNFNYLDILSKALTIKGTIMCTRDQARRLVRMVESGSLPLGEKAGMGRVRSYKLEDGEAALDAAAKWREPGEINITP